MSVPASVVLTTARTLLNDDVSSLWNDPVLIPKLQQAHRELQAKLKAAGAPVMRTLADTVVVTGSANLPLPIDLVEPIRLWEVLQGDNIANFLLMTESDPLPNLGPNVALIYWQWTNEAVKFIGATTTRIVRMSYWRKLNEPALNTDSIGFINGELYLAPRTAALVSASVGEPERHDALTQLAMMSLEEVIVSNRGRAKPMQKETKRP